MFWFCGECTSSFRIRDHYAAFVFTLVAYRIHRLAGFIKKNILCPGRPRMSKAFSGADKRAIIRPNMTTLTFLTRHGRNDMVEELY